MATYIEKRKVLIDADAFVGLIYKKDANHQAASRIIELIPDVQLITSSFAYGEAITVLSQKAGRATVLKFIKDTQDSSTIIIDIDFAFRHQGEEVFKRQTSKNVSFTDCLNMAVMKEEDIKEIFSFDKIYKKNGFIRLGLGKSLEGEVVEEAKKE